jgi:DNA-binding XRE family transcriptional regulator
MQVHVKTLHTKIDINGKISKKLLKVLKEDFGQDLIVENEEWVNAEEMDWYKKSKKNMTPGKYMKTYRETRGLTQEKLGLMLGSLSRQKVSDIERDRRPLNKEVAKKLAEIFNTSIEKFL